jgi:hypothetical protein
MLTIEEAIKRCEEVASQCELDTDWGIGNHFIDRSGVIDVIECGKEHRQLAEWLRELQAYRKAENEIEQELVNWNDIDNGKCRGLFLATSIIQHYKNEEVNADE